MPAVSRVAAGVSVMNAFREFSSLYFGVIAAAPSAVSQIVTSRWRSKRGVQRSAVSHDLRYVYVNQPELPTHRYWDPLQVLFWTPSHRDNCCVMMCNRECASQPALAFIAHETGSECISVSFRRDNPSSPICFDYYSNGGRTERHLALGIEDTGERMRVSTGEQLWFEDELCDDGADPAGLLTEEMLVRYLKRLGYDVAANDFWKAAGEAWLVWEDMNGRRKSPGRVGVDADGTRTGWLPGYSEPERQGRTNTYHGVDDFLAKYRSRRT